MLFRNSNELFLKFKVAILSSTLLGVLTYPVFSQTQTFSGNETTNGPFNDGEQHFFDNSALNAVSTAAISGGTQLFNQSSTLNASTAYAITDGVQFFFDSSTLNASASSAINGGMQSFTEANTLNATAAGAINNGTQIFNATSTLNASAAGAITGGDQNFHDTSFLDAGAAGSISGGTQNFAADSFLNANASEAINGGEQTFFSQSSLNVNAAGAIIGGLQYFNEYSTLNASAVGSISGGTQYLYDNSSLNARAADAINGGAQYFHANASLNASADGAISGGTQIFIDSSTLNANVEGAISGGFQTFYNTSTLNLNVANSISDGQQSFYNTSTLEAGLANALSGGIQYFYENSILNASAGDAISGGFQTLNNNTVLYAMTADAISGGTQQFYDTAILDASSADAISGGMQIFYSDNILSANATGAISNGEQHFQNTGILDANTKGAVSGGAQYFFVNSILNANAADAISGGIQYFYDTATFDASVTDALSNGKQVFFMNSTLRVLAQNSLTTTANVNFDNKFGGIGGILQLNGYDTVAGGINSLTKGSGRIVNNGDTNSVLTINTSLLAPAFYSGAIYDGSGVGSLAMNVAGGQLTFTGTATHTGGTDVSGGVLLVGVQGQAGGLVTGAVNVGQNGILGGVGTVGTTTNQGIISVGRTPDNKFSSNGIFTITGDYIGQNGLVLIDSVLGSDNSLTDKLVIEGDTAGSSSVIVTNIGGTGEKTVNGIKIIEVGGASDGQFSLIGNYKARSGQQVVVGGEYAYSLFQGVSSDPTDGNWYLRSQFQPTGPVDPVDPVNPDPLDPVEPEPLYQAGVPVYEAYPQALLGLNGVATLQQRTSNRVWSGNGNRVVAQGADAIGSPYAAPDEVGAAINGNGVWGRIEGSHNHMEPRFSTSDTNYNQNVFKMQAGIDGMLTETENGKLIGGFTVHYAHGKTKTNSAHGDGDISTDGYGLGGTLTWYGENGFYLDGQGQVTWYRSDLHSTTANIGLTDNNHGFGYALSLEGGQRFAINEAWSLTPQAQLTYSNVDFDAFTDAFDADVSLDRGESLQGRLGLTIDHENSWQNANGMLDRTRVYGIANLYYEFLKGTRVTVAESSFTSRNDRVWGGLGLGGSYNWNDDKYSIYGEGLVNTSLNHFGDSYAIKGNVGFKVKW